MLQLEVWTGRVCTWNESNRGQFSADPSARSAHDRTYSGRSRLDAQDRRRCSARSVPGLSHTAECAEYGLYRAEIAGIWVWTRCIHCSNEGRVNDAGEQWWMGVRHNITVPDSAWIAYINHANGNSWSQKWILDGEHQLQPGADFILFKNKQSWNRIGVSDGAWGEPGGGGVHEHDAGGGDGMRGDGVGVGDRSSMFVRRWRPFHPTNRCFLGRVHWFLVDDVLV